MLILLSFLQLLPTHTTSSDYHAIVITKESLCLVPEENGPLMNCKTTAVQEERDAFQQVDCNQDQCSCNYKANSFQQKCVFNKSLEFTRTCYDFERNCTLFNMLYGGKAECQERYGRCEVDSAPLASRFGVGYPQYNPPVCYPGLRAAKDGCNATFTGCKGDLTIEFTDTESFTLLACENKCQLEETSCTNYTKSCADSVTYWEDGDRASDVNETCDVITNKCVLQRAIKWFPPEDQEKKAAEHNRRPKRGAHLPKQQTMVVTSYDCSQSANLSHSLESCKASINHNMKYKAECQLYGVMLTDVLFRAVYAGNTTVAKVAQYLGSEWEGVIKELCKLDCFRSLTRELRFCIADLPLQNILPGITTHQFQELMYRSEDLLCASTKEKQIKETCVVYLDSTSGPSMEVIKNMTQSACGSEREQWNNGAVGDITCSAKCKKYLTSNVINRHDMPGCCLADILKYREDSAPWPELLAPDIFKKNYILNLVDQCGLTPQLSSCLATEKMHPAVIFVIAVIGVFSTALVTGVVIFIVVFYRQMEYEGYKKGFLSNMVS